MGAFLCKSRLEPRSLGKAGLEKKKEKKRNETRETSNNSSIHKSTLEKQKEPSRSMVTGLEANSTQPKKAGTYLPGSQIAG